MVQTWNYQDRHRRNVPVIVAKSDAICELYNLWGRENDREPERLANARLIAAAPELLNALRVIYANAAESPEWIRARIGPAIAKAEGGEA